MFDEPSLNSLVTSGVSSHIAPLLADKDHTIREAATGALKFAKRLKFYNNICNVET